MYYNGFVVQKQFRAPILNCQTLELMGNKQILVTHMEVKHYV